MDNLCTIVRQTSFHADVVTKPLFHFSWRVYPATSTRLSIWLTSFLQIRTLISFLYSDPMRTFFKKVFYDLKSISQPQPHQLSSKTILDKLSSTLQGNVGSDFSASTNKWYIAMKSAGAGYENSLLKAIGIRVQSYDHEIFIWL